MKNNKNNKKNKKKLSKKNRIYLMIGLLIAAIAFSSIFFYLNKDNIDEISYKEFNSKLKNNEVNEVFIDLQSAEFEFTDKNDNRFITTNPRRKELKEELLLKDVKVTETQKGQMLGLMISIVAQIGVWMMLLYFIMKITMPKANMNSLVAEMPDVEFKNVQGIDEIKRDMEFIINFLKNPKKYEDMGARMHKGVILYGPPGTGKTLTAKAIAGEAGVPFYSVSGSEFIEMYVGLGAKRVRELYQEARENAPCIVFIDEIDAVGGHRGGSGDAGTQEKNQTINQLLTELDGFDGTEGIITIAATNRVDNLDSALVRPGRFDKHIAIPLPDKNGRYEILKVHANNKKLAEDVDLKEVASMTTNFSGAALESLMNEAAFIAVNNKHEFITMEDIELAFFRQVMKGDKKDNQSLRDKKELELVAWHEAGHALLTKLLTNDEVPKVTILSSTSGAGGVTFTNPEESNLYSKEYIESKIKVMYGGRIAEFLLFGDENKITTGASNDIEHATKMIKSYIFNFGMNKEFGMININTLFGDGVAQTGTNAMVLKEAKELSNKLYKEALDILTENKDILSAIANELLEKESLNDKELEEIINVYKK